VGIATKNTHLDSIQKMVNLNFGRDGLNAVAQIKKLVMLVFVFVLKVKWK